MKLFFIILLAFGSMTYTPADFKEGTTKDEVLNICPNYHFLFTKTMSSSITDEKISISMIGYWENKKGCVLHFTNDKLFFTKEFGNLVEYKRYITNPIEQKNIIIKQENLK